MKVLGTAAPYAANQLMNANAAYLGYAMIVFAAFNSIFLAGFFKTAYKIGKPFLMFCIVNFIIISVGEILHHLPGLESLNDPSNLSIAQLVLFAIGATVFLLCTCLSYQTSRKDFELIDL